MHRRAGKLYLVLMAFTALVSLLLPAYVGPTLLGHFGPIHSLSVLTVATVPMAYVAAKRGSVRAHASAMLSLYVGGLVIAGAFAFSPGRLLHAWMFGT